MSYSRITSTLASLLLAGSSHLMARSPACESGGVSVYKDFPGAAFESCRFDSDGNLRLKIEPEDASINPSAWYAFRLNAITATQQRIILEYPNGRHRYLPDTRTASGEWAPLAIDAVIADEDGKTAQFSLSLGSGQQLTVAAQPLLVSDDYMRWLKSLSAHSQVTYAEVGRSPENRPIPRLSTRAQEYTLLLLGRQHPPETTGAQAMITFVERLLADDELAQRFRAEVGILAYPLINPDGVDRGHWRHNTGSTDLNRDWGPFTQIETRTVAEDVDRYLQAHSTRLIKSIDFHSTWYEVFYTQEPGTAQVMPELLEDWLAGFNATMTERDTSFELNRAASNGTGRPTAKLYFFQKYGVASTTLEMGDATSPAFIAEYATVAAESFMRAWLNR